MNCANGSWSIRKTGLSGMQGMPNLQNLQGLQSQMMGMNGQGFQKFGNNSFNRSQFGGAQQMFSNMRF